MQKIIEAEKMETDGKMLFKLMSIAIYGKTMENIKVTSPLQNDNFSKCVI